VEDRQIGGCGLSFTGRVVDYSGALAVEGLGEVYRLAVGRDADTVGTEGAIDLPRS